MSRRPRKSIVSSKRRRMRAEVKKQIRDIKRATVRQRETQKKADAATSEVVRAAYLTGTVEQLRDRAKSLGVKRYSKMNKERLVNAILAAEAAS